MYRILGLMLVLVIIGASPAYCESVAYAFGEAGKFKLDQYSLSEFNGSEILTLTIATGSGDKYNRIVCPTDKNITFIKDEINKRVEVGNKIVIDEATYLAQQFPGDHSLEQVCAIYDYLISNWNYTGDPRCEDYYRYANQTIQLGERSGIAGAGDCDDFAILMAALIENIGGTTRINLVYDESLGHAYTEVCIGQINDSDNRVNKTINWLRRGYKADTIHLHVDEDSNYAWLNLDWWADHPGGPFYEGDNHINLVRIRPDLPIVPLNPPNIPPVAIISCEPEEPNAGETIIFDASQSFDPFGQIDDYKWDFGDGKTGEGISATHNYSEGGTFTVKLVVIDDDGATNSTDFAICVNKPPAASFTYTPADPSVDEAIIFSVSDSMDEDGDIEGYTWEFSDIGVQYRGVSATHPPLWIPGNFTATLIVTDDKGATNTSSKLVTVRINKWARTFGGTGEDVGRSVQETSDGGYIIIGYTNSYGAGENDTWLIKTDSDGYKIWHKTLGWEEEDFAFCVDVAKDGGYIIASYTKSYGSGSYDIWLIKTYSDGNKMWDKTFGGTASDFAYSVQNTNDGGYIITGRTKSYGSGNNDIWLIKTDSDGNKMWDKTFGGTGSDWADSVKQTSDGGYITVGTTESYGEGSQDVWLIKTDSDGNKIWDETFGGIDSDFGCSVQETIDGGYIISGETESYGSGYADLWLIKTDSEGNRIWDKILGGIDEDGVSSVQQTSDGGYIIASTTESYGSGGSDIWLIKTDSDGNKMWGKTFGGTSDDYGNSVLETSDGGYIIVGTTDSYGAAGHDIWLIKTDKYGNSVI